MFSLTNSLIFCLLKRRLSFKFPQPSAKIQLSDMWNKSEITFTQIFPRGTAYQSEYDTKETKKLSEGYQGFIERTWDNQPIDHDPISISMKWHFERVRGAPHKRVIKVNLIAPLFDDPEPPFEPGPTEGLWNHEVIELFFANDQGHYIEVEVGPHGHWLCLFFKGVRQCINDGKDIDLVIENVFDIDVWKCELEIPLAYLPGCVSKFNAYAIHGVGDNRVYEALHPMTDNAFTEPDFHRFQYFKRIDTARFIPESYNYRPFVDMKFGNMWRVVSPDDDEGETSVKKAKRDDDNVF